MAGFGINSNKKYFFFPLKT